MPLSVKGTFPFAVLRVMRPSTSSGLTLDPDEGFTHRLTKRVIPPAPEGVRAILAQAVQLHAAVSSDRGDFDRAKEKVMRQTHL